MGIATIEPIETTITKDDAQRLADQYLATHVGNAYRATRGFYGNGQWYFLIRYFHYQDQGSEHSDNEPREISTCEKLIIDTEAREVIPLTDEQIRDVHEAPFVFMAEEKGELARSDEGYVLRYQARRVANTYLRDHLPMNFSAAKGLLVPLGNPIWQFPIRFRMGCVGTVEPLGLLDVDAHSCKVTPLPSPQLKQIWTHVNAIVEHSQLAPAA